MISLPVQMSIHTSHRNNALLLVSAFGGLALACANAEYAAVPAALGEDGGTEGCVPQPFDEGERVLGETSASRYPVSLMSWEAPHAGVLKIGEGRSSLQYRSLQTLQLDADGMLSFMLNARPVIKLQDHPTAGYLWHMSEVRRFWFGNTIRQPVELLYQGATLGNGPAVGEPMLIRGQGVHGSSTATSVRGGDIELRAGDASSLQSIPLDGGEVVIGGGRVEGAVVGNVAIHDPPNDWCQMEGGLFVHNAVTPPDSGPSNGGFLYAQDGALYWRGSAGTITQLAPP